ncbi:tRNA uridine-5-carboxymethylaminomethyl(34) synthesis GTPase MnmE [Kaistia dalseonensis]|uniref:tRNA modification GTPase MnmE n=1 Tax=Kaistia dalseonensis TaxID=410840 RepID=A0ABU0H530_9HYPH|nr:tRNA uridine-5-carboxymethylaminomethyl(34) synthesis GTPase MnmE [Kaistia dalseonensis]MCX5494835.1 tRNA uridine-5-carboxymethylaminomethyl(34) synthesis GTPase MnmE [Kaistia dalseonensis]MDQ0437416.1 tRNA modification GTPase [Kaistia dalseonensis]
MDDTIFALSSGAPPVGVAVIRLSGPRVRFGLEMILGAVPEPRIATLRVLRDPASGEALDRGLVLFFAGPSSFTGEDVAEFQVHGGRAVVASILAMLAALPGYRPAEAGEFTRRAFANGRADLTEIEGLADLVAAETEMQRRLALRQAEGGLRRLYDDWRTRLIRARALIEADLDFSDEEDVPDDVAAPAWASAAEVAAEIGRHLDDSHFGERVRSGFEVVLLGAPNVGKSSLLNALIRREAAIVTAEPGTTRDLIEVALDLRGHAVTLIDTAGLREADNLVEREGIRRARKRADAADLILVLTDGGSVPDDLPADVPRLLVRTKADLLDSDSKRIDPEAGLLVSSQTGAGLDRLETAIAAALKLDRPMPSAMVTRARQRHGLEEARQALADIEQAHGIEVKAEMLRRAADAIGRITGRIDVEDLLDVIFSEFCIGK